MTSSQSNRVIYWGSGSIPAWRALATLHAKGLLDKFESKMVEFSKGEHKSPDVMAINPRGQVPAFKDGDAIVNESYGIMVYLDKAYPDPALMPKAGKECAEAWQRFAECNGLWLAIQPLFMTRMTKPDYDKERFAQGVEKARKELAVWDGHLSADPQYVACSEFSLADVLLSVTLFFAMRGGAKLNEYPHLQKYAAHMKERPCFRETWPPHWLTSDDKDWLADL